MTEEGSAGRGKRGMSGWVGGLQRGLQRGSCYQGPRKCSEIYRVTS